MDFEFLEQMHAAGMNSTGHYNHSDDDEIVFEEMRKLAKFWLYMEKIYQPLELLIYAVGLMGNFLAFITLTKSKKMCTPSFAYHRALVTADFIYCSNYFLNLIIKKFLSVECRENIYRFWIAAFYNGTMRHVISSVCSYLLHYVTIVIALDRVLALLFALGYHKWNQSFVAKLVIAAAFLMSSTVHSWSAYLHNEVNEFRAGDKEDQHHARMLLISNPCWTDNAIFYSIPRTNLSAGTKQALKIKEYYNVVWKIAYATALTVLTLLVIAGLIRRKKRQEARRSTVCMASVAFSEVSSVADTKLHKVSIESNNSVTIKKRSRGSEKVLFWLMIAVLVLAFFQVAASETNRIFLMLNRPKDLPSKLEDPEIPLEEKLWLVKISMYSQFSSRVLSAAFTAVERNFVCILYIAMNALFRRELLAMLKLICLWKFYQSCMRKCDKIRKWSRRISGRDSAQLDSDQRNRFLVVDLDTLTESNYRTSPLSVSSRPML